MADNIQSVSNNQLKAAWGAGNSKRLEISRNQAGDSAIRAASSAITNPGISTLVSAVSATYDFVTSQLRYDASVATHERSAFVFSTRANTRVGRYKKTNQVMATPLIARMTSASPDNVAGLNRPYIQVLKNGEGGDYLDPRNDASVAVDETEKKRFFDMFILTSVNVVDAEKMDVVETFGNPHFFASGRFAKKLTLTGLIRSEARAYTVSSKGAGGAQVANSAVDTERNMVSDYVVFRNFYEQYLRATVMADYGTFCRVFVDGDFFDGFVQALQFGRESSTEQVVPWTMTMVLFQSWNVNDNIAKSLLKEDMRGLEKKKPSLTDRQAQAEIVDATGQCDLYVVPTGDPDAVAQVEAGASGYKEGTLGTFVLREETTEPTANGATVSRPSLYAVGKGYRGLKVSVEPAELAEAVSLVFDTAGRPAVNDSTAPAEATSLGVKILNYSALSSYAKSAGREDNTDVNIAFRIQSRTGSSVTVFALLMVSQLASLKVVAGESRVESTVSTIVAQPLSSVPGSSAATNVFAVFPAKDRTKTIDPAGNFRFTLYLQLADNIRTVQLTDTAGVHVSLSPGTSVYPGTMTPASNGMLASSLATSSSPDAAATSSMELESADASGLSQPGGHVKCVLRGTIPGASGWDPVESPFRFSDAVSFACRINIEIPGYRPISVVPVLHQLTGPAAFMQGLFTSARPQQSASGGRLFYVVLGIPEGKLTGDRKFDITPEVERMLSLGTCRFSLTSPNGSSRALNVLARLLSNKQEVGSLQTPKFVTAGRAAVAVAGDAKAVTFTKVNLVYFPNMGLPRFSAAAIRIAYIVDIEDGTDVDYAILAGQIKNFEVSFPGMGEPLFVPPEFAGE